MKVKTLYSSYTLRIRKTKEILFLAHQVRDFQHIMDTYESHPQLEGHNTHIDLFLTNLSFCYRKQVMLSRVIQLFPNLEESVIKILLTLRKSLLHNN